MNRTVVTLALAASLLSGCGIVGKSRPKTPVVGDRISVLSTDPDVQVDPTTAALPFAIPAPEVNASWNQPGGTPSKSAGHPALGATVSEAWQVSAGQGTSVSERLAAPPVVANGTVYTIDTTATVRAFDAATGGQRWAVQFGTEKGNNASLFGGGVAVEGDRVFATNGLGFVAALSTANGAQIWQVRPGGPLRGAPTIAGDTLYVMSQDNQLYSLKTADGKTSWSATAAVEIAGVFGTAAPGVRARHGGGGLLERRAQRLSLRERPPGLAGRACPHLHLDQRRDPQRHRRVAGDRQWPGVRARSGRPDGRARPHQRSAHLGAQPCRHRHPVDRRRLAVRR